MRAGDRKQGINKAWPNVNGHDRSGFPLFVCVFRSASSLRIRLVGLPLCASLCDLLDVGIWQLAGHVCVLCQLFYLTRTVDVEKKK